MRAVAEAPRAYGARARRRERGQHPTQTDSELGQRVLAALTDRTARPTKAAPRAAPDPAAGEQGAGGKGDHLREADPPRHEAQIRVGAARAGLRGRKHSEPFEPQQNQQLSMSSFSFKSYIICI